MPRTLTPVTYALELAIYDRPVQPEEMWVHPSTFRQALDEIRQFCTLDFEKSDDEGRFFLLRDTKIRCMQL